MMEQTIPMQSGFYFGWRIITALALMAGVLVGVAISSFVMFSVPFAAEFGWTEGETGTLVSAMWLTGPLAVVLGPFVERLGPWRMVVAGMLVQAVALVAAGFVSTYPQMVAVRVVMGVGMVTMVTAGPVIVSHWFKRRFSSAMAIAWSAPAAGQILFGPFTVMLTANYGWRSASFILALLVLATVAVALLIANGGRSPEQMGISVEGVEGTEDHGDHASSGWRSSLGSINWYAAAVMCLAAFGAGLTTIALQAGIPVLFGGLGMTQSTAALLLSTFSAFALVGVLAAGWLLDRLPQLFNSVLVTAMVGGGLLMLALTVHLKTAGTAYLAMALMGYGLGAGEIMWVTLFKRQFGAAVFGATYGLFYCSFQLGMASGGVVGGLAYQWGGAAALVLALALPYLPPALFSAWRPGKMVSPLILERR